jgi:hypothetical protein
MRPEVKGASTLNGGELKIATMRELDSGESVERWRVLTRVSSKRLETWRGEWHARGEQRAFPGGSNPLDIPPHFRLQ